ncbi:MAG: hypothetical protein JXB85_12500 [Anaerolineales bacterium]|nr:hypothetical protein [Anaerolineales bacterium]
MRSILRIILVILVVLVVGLSITACTLPTEEAPTLDPDSGATPTPTPTPFLGSPGEESSEPSPCQGLRGEIEVRVLVGPADVVGLEPVAIGTAPFSVVSSEPPFVIQGGGAIEYYDVLVEEWGTYEVSMDLLLSIGGECVVEENQVYLDLQINIAGTQLVIVTAEGFSGEYPWTGEYTFPWRFPAVSGASASGEGWEFVLLLAD